MVKSLATPLVYVKKPPINANTYIPSRIRILNVGLSFNLHPSIYTMLNGSPS